ncbi:serine/threonine-protein kinase [Streptomyces sp. B1866]|uniref:serine/threonine-protein kinase n=1 Tax=Streptomyces sp. B1866 TaxID=3075431 RepID=UPI002890BBD0|nr:serine/threonine-protein kinase [Streptomyces sp. B1866]MDT3397493.1 serine/threonine-protein kinase [Streptomyces sp. B1866]
MSGGPGGPQGPAGPEGPGGPEGGPGAPDGSGGREDGRDGSRNRGRDGQRYARLVAGRYRLLGELGRGGMGVVWQARDEVLGREVAVKEVRAPAGLADRDVALLYARLEREGRAAARVTHRNVVTVYDVAVEAGHPWIVMELVRGLSLADVIRHEGALPPARAAAVGTQVLAALRAAHGAGVLHRDVKPANVLLANDGRAVLTDFGIAVAEGDSALTLTGELLGSPEFLAPERALGHAPGPASDLWSLGVTLYAAVEGRSPFRQDTPLSTLRAVVDEPLPPPRRAGPLAPVLDGLLRKDPASRLTADEAERMLRIAAAGGTPRATPPPGGTAPTRVLAAPSPYAPHGPYDSPYAPEGPGGPGGPGGPPSGPLPPGADTPPHRPRRAVAAVVAGAVAAVLALGGLTWALIAVNSGGDDKDGGASQESPSGGATAGRSSGASATGSGPSTASASASPSPTGYALTVVLRADRGSYAGACPPPAAQAPAFSATLTVDRDATVEYRWITGSGEVSGGGWQTARLDGGEPLTVRHAETGYEPDGTRRDWIAVETRSPKSVTSNRASFAVVCQEAPPSGGASSPAPSASASASGQGGSTG